jgi:hypothetical protein
LKRLLLCITFFIFVNSSARAQDTLQDTVSINSLTDTSAFKKDTVKGAKKDTLSTPVRQTKLHGLPHYSESRHIYFYVIACIFLFLGILRTAFGKYFSNMMRVFFNTSLRQMQLTDQLLHDQLPSLLFNIFFILVAGTYLFLLVDFLHPIHLNPYLLWLFAFLSVLCIYVVKYIAIRFTGWVTGFLTDAASYMFIVFLVNKVLAVMLLPFIALIAFADDFLKLWAVYTSLVLFTLAFLVRYIKTYGLMREKHKMSFFHFMLYIIAIEALPIALVYHFLMEILNKNL